MEKENVAQNSYSFSDALITQGQTIKLSKYAIVSRILP